MRFDTDSYSVPTKYAHRSLTVIGTVDEVRIIFEDRLVARHPRCWDREQFHFDPIHDLALLERKPGGFDFARPSDRWELPEGSGVLRRQLEADGSDGFGTRGFIRVLRLPEAHSLPQLTDAVDWALAIDGIDPAGIGPILDHRADRPVPVFSLDGRPHLAGVRVPATDVAAYGAPLAGEGSR